MIERVPEQALLAEADRLSDAVRHDEVIELLAAHTDSPDPDARLRTLGRALAARTRSALAVAASAAGVAWSFSVHRGEPSEEVGKIAGPGDIVVVGPGDHIVGPRPTTGHALVQAAAHASGSIVLGRARLHVARPLVLAQMESMLIERALAAAVRLVDPAHPELDVLTVGASDQGIARLRGLIDDLLGPRRINIRVRNVELANVAHLALQAAALGNDLVIVESEIGRAHV